MRNLQVFTTALATSDDQVRAFNTDLASVADQLAGERGELALALKNLAVALGEVASFVQDNRANLTTDIAGLADITGVLAKQKDALAEILDAGPVALSNLQIAYNPASGTLDTRDNAAAARTTRACSSARCSTSLGQPKTVCDQIDKVLKNKQFPQPGGAARSRRRRPRPHPRRHPRERAVMRPAGGRAHDRGGAALRRAA